jgi:hypothetical protein
MPSLWAAVHSEPDRRRPLRGLRRRSLAMVLRLLVGRSHRGHPSGRGTGRLVSAPSRFSPLSCRRSLVARCASTLGSLTPASVARTILAACPEEPPKREGGRCRSRSWNFLWQTDLVGTDRDALTALVVQEFVREGGEALSYVTLSKATMTVWSGPATGTPSRSRAGTSAARDRDPLTPGARIYSKRPIGVDGARDGERVTGSSTGQAAPIDGSGARRAAAVTTRPRP